MNAALIAASVALIVAPLWPRGVAGPVTIARNAWWMWRAFRVAEPTAATIATLHDAMPGMMRAALGSVDATLRAAQAHRVIEAPSCRRAPATALYGPPRRYRGVYRTGAVPFPTRPAWCGATVARHPHDPDITAPCVLPAHHTGSCATTVAALQNAGYCQPEF